MNKGQDLRQGKGRLQAGAAAGSTRRQGISGSFRTLDAKGDSLVVQKGGVTRYAGEPEFTFQHPPQWPSQSPGPLVVGPGEGPTAAKFAALRIGSTLPSP